MESEVVIVGAGVAGLAAAQALARQGRRVTIVDARARVGGRVTTEWPAGWPVPVELGAEFIHGGNADLRRVLRRGRIATRPVTPHMWWWERDELRAVPDFWKRVRRVVDLIPASRRRWSFQDFIRTTAGKMADPDWRMISWYIGSFEAAPLEKLSAVALRTDHAGADTDDGKFVGRGTAVPEQLLADCPPERVELRLQTAVEAIRWRPSRVD
ncbi:MAG TPA: FAD-dependent oxidoreductase, partial [Candidatus Didemnitutus sp.]|nr:FAD-dependent oxidoreductase [Candidatus Didemnitutus sp.]